jgi:hypothetical protein
MDKTLGRLFASVLAAILVDAGLLLALLGMTYLPRWVGIVWLFLGIVLVLSPLRGLHKALNPFMKRPIPPQRLRYFNKFLATFSILGPLMLACPFGLFTLALWRVVSLGGPADWTTSVQLFGFALGAVFNIGLLVFNLLELQRRHREA